MKREKDERVSKELKRKIFERDNYTCKYCGQKFEVGDLEIDHIRPVCLGGDSRESNLATSCMHCNRKKGFQRYYEFESEEDKKEFDERYREKVRSYGYYTNYIKKVLSSNGRKTSRTLIDRYVKKKIKNDEDFEEFRKRLREKGVSEINREIIDTLWKV